MTKTRSDERIDGLLLEVGLTGGIASGKSTVDSMMEEFGAAIIDADALAHGLLRPGAAEHGEVVKRFGTKILRRGGTVDRKALAAIVFNDAAARADLNTILHPGVRREEDRLKDEIRKDGGGIVVTDAALLVETGRWKLYDRLVVVACDPSLQISRLVAREPGMTTLEARRRLEAQAPVEEKLAVADYVIDTNGSLSDTRRLAHDVYQQLVEDLEAKRQGEPLPRRQRRDHRGEQ